MLGASVEMFNQDCGRYPSQSEGLAVLVDAPAGLANWHGPYCKKTQLVDPWRNALVYKRPGTHNSEYDIISYGADGIQSGEGVNADGYND